MLRYLSIHLALVAACLLTPAYSYGQTIPPVNQYLPLVRQSTAPTVRVLHSRMAYGYPCWGYQVCIVGEVANELSYQIESVRVVATVCNSTQYVCTGFGYTADAVLAPGATSLFAVQFVMGEPPLFSSYDLAVTWTP